MENYSVGNIPKVSVIVPTYNVEPFLLQCLTSIAEQTYKNFECIIIIDGATDRSFEIAKDFCKLDARFHAYWQENAGSGPARNNGLDKSTGDLIMFVDPDDWCKPDYIENMVRLQQSGDYDIVSTSEITVFFNNKGEIKKILPPHYIEAQYIGEEQLHERYLSLFCDGYLLAPHCKIYKSSIIDQYNIRFPDLRRSQDIVFNYRYYDHAQSILISNYSGYMYRVLSKERAKRLKPDYYLTIGIIYNDIKSLHDKWGIKFNIQMASTFLFSLIYTLFESNILRGESIGYLVKDKIMREIIVNARPQKIHLSIIRHLILNGHYRMSAFIVKLILYVKLLVQ